MRLLSLIGMALLLQAPASSPPDLQKQIVQLKLQNAQLRQQLSQCAFNEAKRDEAEAAKEGAALSNDKK